MVAVALSIAIPVIGVLPLVSVPNGSSPAIFSGTITFDDPHAPNGSPILANRVTFGWNISTVEPFREDSYERVGFFVRAAIGPGVKNVSMGTVSVVLYDTSNGRPRFSFNGEMGLPRYIAPSMWTDYGDDYVLVSSAKTAPYYIAIWLVGTVFYKDGGYGLFGDQVPDLRRVTVLPAYARIDAGIVVAGEVGAGLFLLGIVLVRKRRSHKPPRGAEIAPPPMGLP